MSTLEVKSLTKRFGSLVAVRDVSMTVAKGELRAVIGPNGAGKTTFFNLVSGFFAPTSGSILFEGRDVAGFSAHERVGMGMARTFQITEIFPELTVFENVRIAAEVAAGYRLRPWLSRADTAELRRRVEETLALAGLTGKANRLVGELAHGDQRAAEIAMALALKPRLLLLDEPTAGMGDQETYEITQLDPPAAQGRQPDHRADRARHALTQLRQTIVTGRVATCQSPAFGVLSEKALTMVSM